MKYAIFTCLLLSFSLSATFSQNNHLDSLLLRTIQQNQLDFASSKVNQENNVISEYPIPADAYEKFAENAQEYIDQAQRNLNWKLTSEKNNFGSLAHKISVNTQIDNFYSRNEKRLFSMKLINFKSEQNHKQNHDEVISLRSGEITLGNHPPNNLGSVRSNLDYVYQNGNLASQIYEINRQWSDLHFTDKEFDVELYAPIGIKETRIKQDQLGGFLALDETNFEMLHFEDNNIILRTLHRLSKQSLDDQNFASSRKIICLKNDSTMYSNLGNFNILDEYQYKLLSKSIPIQLEECKEHHRNRNLKKNPAFYYIQISCPTPKIEEISILHTDAITVRYHVTLKKNDEGKVEASFMKSE